MTDAPDERQRRLAEFATDDATTDSDTCTAIAESTGEQCQRDRLTERVPYCPLHLHLFDLDSDTENPSNPPKTDV
jgi:hypothetical protein